MAAAPAFLFYSGAAGGILHALLLFGLTGAVVWLWRQRAPAASTVSFYGGPRMGRYDLLTTSFQAVGMLFLYVYCYGLSAIALRRLLFGKEQAIFTWVLAAVLMALGRPLPLLLAFLVHGGRWHFTSDYGWTLFNPIAGMMAAGEGFIRPHVRDAFVLTVVSWAVVATVLNIPWFYRQMARFCRYVPAPVPCPRRSW